MNEQYDITPDQAAERNVALRKAANKLCVDNPELVSDVEITALQAILQHTLGDPVAEHIIMKSFVDDLFERVGVL